VKDMLNGMMIILEDQFNVGDTVRLTGMTGVVETMTLRRTEIRDGDGTLYIVPNSQITTVANLSRDFSAATVNVSVDFSAEPDKVTKLLTSIAMDIRNDPAYTTDFLGDPQVLGVDSIKGSELIYPVVFKTTAMKQYSAIREFRRRVRIALEAQGMLPGDPNRPLREYALASEAKSPEAGSVNNPHTINTPVNGSINAPREEHRVDPTAIPAVTHNPFTGEGM